MRSVDDKLHGVSSCYNRYNHSSTICCHGNQWLPVVMAINMSCLLTSIDLPKHSICVLTRLYDCVLIELSFLSVRSFLSVAAFHNSVSWSSDFWYFRRWEDTLIPGTCRQCKLFICLPGTLFIAGTLPDL